MWQTYLSLIVAIVAGSVVSAPFLASRVQGYQETTYIVGNQPPDDDALRNWGLSMPRVVSFQVERRGTELWIRTVYRSLAPQPPLEQTVARLRSLGYEFLGMRGGSTGMLSSLPELLTDAQILAAMLAGMQLAFGGLALIRIRSARGKGERLAPLFPASRNRPLAAGFAGGVVLLGLGALYSCALQWLFGHAPASPWDSASTMPATTKVVFLLFGGLGAPVAEELFFRGYVFGRFKAAGHVGLGLLVSSVLFGLVHFSDPFNVPCICLFGLVLAWLFHRTGSLLAPIIAHAVNNCVQIGFMVLA